ncbi:hypothetical protein JCM8097_006809 [Rhodosporidiobolus ruineniae]
MSYSYTAHPPDDDPLHPSQQPPQQLPATSWTEQQLASQQQSQASMQTYQHPPEQLYDPLYYQPQPLPTHLDPHQQPHFAQPFPSAYPPATASTPVYPQPSTSQQPYGFPPQPSSPSKSTSASAALLGLASGGLGMAPTALPREPTSGSDGDGDTSSGGAVRQRAESMLTQSQGLAGGGGVGPVRRGSTATSAGRAGASTIAAAGTGGAGGGVSAQSPVVAALAAGVGPRTTEKSCKNCRLRRVKCDRQWPRCNRCTQRNEDCSFGTFVPVDVIPPAALQTAMVATGVGGLGQGGVVAGREAALEARIQSLEVELAQARRQSTGGAGGPTGPGGIVSPASSHSDRTGLAHGGGAVVGFQPIEGLHSAFVPQQGRSAAQASLSETIQSVFVAGAGMGPPGGEDQRTVESFLHGIALSDPVLYGVEQALGSGRMTELGLGLTESMGGSGIEARLSLSEGSSEWSLARKQMGRTLVIHLVQSFFASCCAYLPAFHGWPDRRSWILANIDNLDPASRVAVAAFCAMGARASPHSALLGIPLTSPSPSDSFAHASAAGIRREQACRALHTQAMDLVHLLGITLDATKENLEAIMVVAQMLIFNELVPRRSRSMVHSALGHFKELQESSLPPNVKDDLVRHIGLPLLTCDAITCAYARKKPLITDRDLEDYFPSFSVQDFKQRNIQTVLQDCLRMHISPEGLLTHEGIGRAAAVVHSWIAQSQRMFAAAAAPKAGGPPDALLDDIKQLWNLLDEIHEGIRKLQEMLVHLSYVPHGCASDGCADQHLRFVTRLDKDLIDVFLLLHTLVSENLGLDSLTGQEGVRAYNESDRRVRKALKLVAFYSELYITSRDPHLCYHVVWQLEVLPNWTSIIVQRHGELGGPASPDLELSETELDWFVKGLMTASFYHPIAASRLQELQQSRRPSYVAHPQLSPDPVTGSFAVPSQQLQHQQHAQPAQPYQQMHVEPGALLPPPGATPATGSVSLYRPSTTHYFIAEAGPSSQDAAPAFAYGGGRDEQPDVGAAAWGSMAEGVHGGSGGGTVVGNVGQAQWGSGGAVAGGRGEASEAGSSGGRGGGERMPTEDPRFTFQGGVTGPSATKEWGHWNDPGAEKTG